MLHFGGGVIQRQTHVPQGGQEGDFFDYT